MTNADERSGPSSSPVFDLRQRWRRSRYALADDWAAIWAGARNLGRKFSRARLDYVVMPVGGPLPERAGPSRGFLARRLPLPPHPFSLQQLNRRLTAVADAENVRGVVFIFRGFNAGLATLQNFRASVARLRAAGKQAIVYTPYLDLAHYYAATAADRIIAPPGAQFDVLGLYTEVTFLKDALARVGVQADVVQISPYKTAFDRLSQAEMTPEYRAQLEWLLDDQYDMLTDDMAAGRGLTPKALRGLIDQAPMPAATAREAGLIDDLAYDDELSFLLAEKPAEATPGAKPPRAKLKTWSAARRDLMEKSRRLTDRYVGVVSLEGLISMGASRRPPVDLPIPFIGGATAGEQTFVGLLRRLERLDNLAAVVLHIDSGGGSALASELIGRQVGWLAAHMPVVIYMGNTAASGGYYVAAAAGAGTRALEETGRVGANGSPPRAYIMSQVGTITGSIGVIMAKLSAAGLFARLSVNRVALARGERAGLYRSADPMTDDERAIFQETIEETYRRFVGLVAQGRGLPAERVADLGGGRVWTGRQAQQHGLVDGHGDMLAAIQKAAELAALPCEDVAAIATANLYPRRSDYAIYPPAGAAADLATLLGVDRLATLAGKPLLLLPYEARLR